MSKKRSKELNIDIENIKDPGFLASLSPKQLPLLANEIRGFIVDKVSKTGGHLSSNLGVVELTVALHYCFNNENDAIIFDIGHQCYTHKILTGRAKEMDTLRKTDGLSGFVSYKESNYDKWESGHAGTAISALTGYLLANEKKGIIGDVVAVVGDSSITNGESFEALNILGTDHEHKGIIILNDNEMSISKPVGGISRLLTKLRGTKFLRGIRRFLKVIFPKKINRFFGRMKRGLKGFLQRTNIFEDLGYTYIGPYDGHDMKSLLYALEKAKNLKKSVVIHVLTEKGHGYSPAENNPTYFHGVGQFEKESGTINESVLPQYSEAIAKIVTDLHKTIPLYVVMPAMTTGSHFEDFSRCYPDWFTDVGIAEEHAATLAASLSLNGIKVFLPFYSTFSQRAYDQILNDISRPNLHVVIGIDRAGFVPEDGSTHQGLYDISMFSSMPNMTIAMPYTYEEAASLVKYAFANQNGPFVIRYPKRRLDVNLSNQVEFNDISCSWSYLKNGKDISLISYGHSLDLLIEAANELNLNANIVNARFIRPIDTNVLDKLFLLNKPILIYEEAFGAPLYLSVLKYANKCKFKGVIFSMAFDNEYVENADYSDLLKKNNLDLASIIRGIKSLL